MKNKLAVVALFSFVFLAGCENIRVGGLSLNKITGLSSGNGATGILDYCKENPGPCVATGILSAAVLAAFIANQKGSSCKKQGAQPNARSIPNGFHGCGGGGMDSDKRLKEDITPVVTLENGLRLYSWHYVGDDRVFVGVLAQDLLEQPEFKDAVITRSNGFYAVDYAKLGLEVANEAAMREAGDIALATVEGLN